MKFLQNIILIFYFIEFLNSQLLPDSFQLWTHEITVETGMEIKWNSEDLYYLTMEISAPTTGYIGIGFSPNGGMKGSDIVIGWVDRDGIPYLVDFYAPEREQPIQDIQQDYDLIAASERDGRTTVRFRRRWDTCDNEGDMRIDEDTVRLIWAWHPSDPMVVPTFTFQGHGSITRGTRSVLLRSSMNSAKFPDEFFPGASNVQQWDLTMKKVRNEGRESTYIAKIFKFPKPTRKHHIIGFRSIINPGNMEFVHHISLFTCTVPDHYGGTRRIFEKYVGGPQIESFTAQTPPEWGTYCLNFLFTWALGSEGEMLPYHIGIPVGDQGDDSTYFKLEVHYSNPMRKTFYDSSGLRIFYTDRLRENDAGTMILGHRVTPFQLIPNFQESFTTHSFCSRECTENGISVTDGVKATSVLLHAHLTGRRIALKHVRNGKELPTILQDKNYDFNFQQFRRLKEEVNILPGDELIVECDYDTQSRNTITFGGLSTVLREMCEAIVLYYPKTDLSDCRSQPEFYSFFNTLGMKNVSGDIFDKMSLPLTKFRPYVTIGTVEITQLDNSIALGGSYEDKLENPFDFSWISNPSSVRNKSVGDYLERLDWKDKDFVQDVQKGWKEGRHYMFCSSSGLRRIRIQESTTTYPQYEPYREKSTSDCRYDDSGTSPIKTLLLLYSITTLVVVLIL